MRLTNQNGSPLRQILIVSKTFMRPIRVFASDQDVDALEYADEGDSVLYMYDDGTRLKTVRGAKSGEKLGSEVAESLLCTDVCPNKSDLLDMCFHKDTEMAKGFISRLLDYVIESHEARG